MTDLSPDGELLAAVRALGEVREPDGAVRAWAPWSWTSRTTRPQIGGRDDPHG
ncbi:MAG: hypothetical protein ACRDSP_08650 [Pseudonocardiaceae bacterium]